MERAIEQCFQSSAWNRKARFSKNTMSGEACFPRRSAEESDCGTEEGYIVRHKPCMDSNPDLESLSKA